MKAVWKGVAKYNNLTVQHLEAEDIVALNQFICGLNSSEIKQLNMAAFKCVHHTELTNFRSVKRGEKNNYTNCLMQLNVFT